MLETGVARGATACKAIRGFGSGACCQKIDLRRNTLIGKRYRCLPGLTAGLWKIILHRNIPITNKRRSEHFYSCLRLERLLRKGLAPFPHLAPFLRGFFLPVVFCS